jgi:hypothetical protein
MIGTARQVTHSEILPEGLNPKSEVLNSKQIPISKSQIQNRLVLSQILGFAFLS